METYKDISIPLILNEMQTQIQYNTVAFFQFDGTNIMLADMDGYQGPMSTRS